MTGHQKPIKTTTAANFSTKRGTTIGAFGGFIASIAFVGIMLWLPMIFSVPVGIFLHALGLSVIKPVELNNNGSTIIGGDIVRIGLAAFGLVLAQGVIVGTIFGIITTRIKRFSITNKKKGIGLGLATGVIAYLLLFVSTTLTVYPKMLADELAKYSQTIPVSLQGMHTYTNTDAILKQQHSSFVPAILGYGLFAYLVYGFILGGILIWANSVFKFNMRKAAELENYRL